MDRLDRLQTYATKLHFVWYLTALIGLFGAWAAANRNALATPIALSYDAIVGPPRQGFDALIPPDWNISLQPGEKITGTFTFDPLDVLSTVHETSSIEPLPFEIHIKSKTLASSVYRIAVADNSNPIDSDGPFDNITFGCTLPGGGTVCTSSAVASSEPLQWAATLTLYGNSSVLDGADIPPGTNTWQQLASYNVMLVSLIGTTTLHSYGFLATIQSFQAVPEPTSLVLLLPIVVLGPIALLDRAWIGR